MSNLVFVVVMVVGIVLIETDYPYEGPRGFSKGLGSNVSNAKCVHDPTCVVFRIVRSVGVFGFFGEFIKLVANARCNDN